MNSIWQTWSDVHRAINGKKVVLFGKSEDWANKTLRMRSFPVAYIVDNNENLHGTTVEGVEVFSPSKLKDEKKDELFILITSGAYESIIPELLDYGFVAGEHFCNVPLMNNLKTLTDIHSHKQRLLVSAPDHHVYSQMDKNSSIGGGIYLYDTESMETQKVISGSFHQISRGIDCFYAIHHFEGVFILSSDLKEVDHFPLDKNSKPHGVTFCPNRNLIFAACSGLDKIAIYDASSFKKVDEIWMSDRINKMETEQHHINDVCVLDDSLFVSMFSFSGYWTNNVFDGGIVEYSLEDFTKKHVLVRDLWMPHSVRILDGNLCFLDSMRGNFHLTDKKVSGHFPGFIRGLDTDGQYYYIGQSEARYFDRLEGLSNSILLNSGFYLFDDRTKATKFFSMSHLVRQVHDVCVYKDE
jgi:hypothetical protein